MSFWLEPTFVQLDVWTTGMRAHQDKRAAAIGPLDLAKRRRVGGDPFEQQGNAAQGQPGEKAIECLLIGVTQFDGFVQFAGAGQAQSSHAVQTLANQRRQGHDVLIAYRSQEIGIRVGRIGSQERPHPTEVRQRAASHSIQVSPRDFPAIDFIDRLRATPAQRRMRCLGADLRRCLDCSCHQLNLAHGSPA